MNHNLRIQWGIIICVGNSKKSFKNRFDSWPHDNKLIFATKNVVWPSRTTLKLTTSCLNRKEFLFLLQTNYSKQQLVWWCKICIHHVDPLVFFLVFLTPSTHDDVWRPPKKTISNCSENSIFCIVKKNILISTFVRQAEMKKSVHV